jgi:hypothetical protein
MIRLSILIFLLPKFFGCIHLYDQEIVFFDHIGGKYLNGKVHLEDISAPGSTNNLNGDGSTVQTLSIKQLDVPINENGNYSLEFHYGYSYKCSCKFVGTINGIDIDGNQTNCSIEDGLPGGRSTSFKMVDNEMEWQTNTLKVLNSKVKLTLDETAIGNDKSCRILSVYLIKRLNVE